MQQLRDVLEELLGERLYQVVLSNPRDKGKIAKAKVRPVMVKGGLVFQETAYVGTQVFHGNYGKEEMIRRIIGYMETDFRQCEIEAMEGRATVLVSKKGRVAVRRKNFVGNSSENLDKNLDKNLERNLNRDLERNLGENLEGNLDGNLGRNLDRKLEGDWDRNLEGNRDRNSVREWDGNRERDRAGSGWWEGCNRNLSHNRVKRYLLEEGKPVPFLIDLGVQTEEGRVVKARYDKFKQINRFLEFIEDILPTLPKEGEIHLVDFGCGKSYLTFAIYYYMKELQGLDVRITGLDLKADVIKRCNGLAEKYGYGGLRFLQGDIGSYEWDGGVGYGRDGGAGHPVDVVVSLHACDTATDYALAKAVEWGAKVILAVPCCQHEVNKQIRAEGLKPLLKYGLLKERAAALVTDAIRANLLEESGYDVQVLEFIDMEHTPKNILLRAVRRGNGRKKETAVKEMAGLLHVDMTLQKLLRG